MFDHAAHLGGTLFGMWVKKPIILFNRRVHYTLNLKISITHIRGLFKMFSNYNT
jgi:hypothetical protein